MEVSLLLLSDKMHCEGEVYVEQNNVITTKNSIIEHYFENNLYTMSLKWKISMLLCACINVNKVLDTQLLESY